MKIKRFMVFAYDQYYPSGGWSDFRESFETLAEAKAFSAELRYDFTEIIDLDTGEDLA